MSSLQIDHRHACSAFRMHDSAHCLENSTYLREKQFRKSLTELTPLTFGSPFSQLRGSFHVQVAKAMPTMRTFSHQRSLEAFSREAKAKNRRSKNTIRPTTATGEPLKRGSRK